RSAARGVHGHVVDQHRHAGRGRGGRAARPAAAHGHVEDDEVAVVGGAGPGRRVHLVRAHTVVLHAVHVPPQLLGGDATVPLDAVGVEGRLAGRARAGPVA